MHQVPTLRSLRWDRCLFESGRLCQTFPPGGVCKWSKRAVLQTAALGGFAGSSPATPVRPFHVGRSSTGRALHCECSTLRVRVPPADLVQQHGALAKPGLRRATLYRVCAGSNPARPAKFYGAVAERLGTGLSIQTTRVRVSSAPPSSTRAASSTGTSTRLLSGGLRVRVPRGASIFGV